MNKSNIINAGWLFAAYRVMNDMTDAALDAGREVTVFDNFCNSQPDALVRVYRITGKQPRLVRVTFAIRSR